MSLGRVKSVIIELVWSSAHWWNEFFSDADDRLFSRISHDNTRS